MHTAHVFLYVFQLYRVHFQMFVSVKKFCAIAFDFASINMSQRTVSTNAKLKSIQYYKILAFGGRGDSKIFLFLTSPTRLLPSISSSDRRQSRKIVEENFGKSMHFLIWFQFLYSIRLCIERLDIEGVEGTRLSLKGKKLKPCRCKLLSGQYFHII